MNEYILLIFFCPVTVERNQLKEHVKNGSKGHWVHKIIKNGHWAHKVVKNGHQVHKVVKKGMPGAVPCQIHLESTLSYAGRNCNLQSNY